MFTVLSKPIWNLSMVIYLQLRILHVIPSASIYHPLPCYGWQSPPIRQTCSSQALTIVEKGFWAVPIRFTFFAASTPFSPLFKHHNQKYPSLMDTVFPDWPFLYDTWIRKLVQFSTLNKTCKCIPNTFSSFLLWNNISLHSSFSVVPTCTFIFHT